MSSAVTGLILFGWLATSALAALTLSQIPALASRSVKYWTSMAILLLLIMVCGIYPKVLLERSHSAVTLWLSKNGESVSR